jgi:hypothetical protein
MLIIVPSERIDLLLRVLQRREPMDVQTLFARGEAHRAICGKIYRVVDVVRLRGR